MKNKMVISSRDLAKKMNEDHLNIIDRIKKLDCSKEFMSSNFENRDYIDAEDNEFPLYGISEDGVRMLTNDGDHQPEGEKKDKEEKVEKVLYLIENEFSRVKIGITSSIDKRVKIIEKIGGFFIIKKYYVKNAETSYLKTKMHKKFEPHRVIGLWFDIDFKEAVDYLNTLT